MWSQLRYAASKLSKTKKERIKDKRKNSNKVEQFLISAELSSKQMIKIKEKKKQKQKQ